MEKVCINCGNRYESGATLRNRKGKCRPCINAGYRKRYVEGKTNEGIDIFEYQKLFEIGLKKCTHCDKVKSLSEFSKRDGDKYRVCCKDCDSIFYKKYQAQNKDRINKKRRELRKRPSVGIILSLRDRQRSLFRNKVKKHRPTTALIRDWLGCTIGECEAHLEKQFCEGMNWSNRGIGRDKWQIDHKIPVSLTEVSDGKVVDNVLNRKIWHFTNLQPLWHIENAKKSNNYEHDDVAAVAA